MDNGGSAADAIPSGEAGKLLQFLKEAALRSIDPTDYAINEACRRHQIPISHARGKGGDHATVSNRRRVLLDLIQEGFGDQVLLDNFLISQRQIERLRQATRKKDGGNLAE